VGEEESYVMQEGDGFLNRVEKRVMARRREKGFLIG